MRFEVAIKGRYRRKRVTLGYIDSQDSKIPADTALEMLGWSFLEERLWKKFFEKDGYLVCLDDISVRAIKDK